MNIQQHFLKLSVFCGNTDTQANCTFKGCTQNYMLSSSINSAHITPYLTAPFFRARLIYVNTAELVKPKLKTCNYI
jgi:hypothetical protein